MWSCHQGLKLYPMRDKQRNGFLKPTSFHWRPSDMFPRFSIKEKTLPTWKTTKGSTRVSKCCCLPLQVSRKIVSHHWDGIGTASCRLLGSKLNSSLAIPSHQLPWAAEACFTGHLACQTLPPFRGPDEQGCFSYMLQVSSCSLTKRQQSVRNPCWNMLKYVEPNCSRPTTPLSAGRAGSSNLVPTLLAPQQCGPNVRTDIHHQDNPFILLKWIKIETLWNPKDNGIQKQITPSW